MAEVIQFGDNTQGAGEFPNNSDRALVSLFRSSHEGRAIHAYAYAGPTSTAGTNAKALIYTSVNGEPGTLVGVSSGGALPAGGGLADLGVIDCKLYAGTDYFVGLVCDNFTGYTAEDTTGGPYVSRMANPPTGLSYANPPSNFQTTLTNYTDVRFNVWVDVLVDSQQVRVPIITRLPKRWTKKPPFGTPIDRSYPLCRDLTLVDPMQTPMPYDILQRHLPFTSSPAVSVAGGPVLGTGQHFVAGGGATRRYNPVAIDGWTPRGATELTAAAIFRMKTPADPSAASAHEWLNCYRSGFTNFRLYSTRNSGDPRKFIWMVHDPLDVAHTVEIATLFALDDAKVHTMVGTFKQNEVLNVYLDGDQMTVGTPFNNTVNTETSPAIAVQTEHTNSQAFNDDVYLVCLWSRCLSDAEVRSFIANPWQIFTPQTPQLAKVANRRLVVR